MVRHVAAACSLIALLATSSQAVAAVDCAKLKTGTEPFELVSKQGDKTTAMQVYPDGKGAAILLLAAGDVVVRQRVDHGLLVASRRSSPRENLRLVIQSTAPPDAFGQKKSFAYDEAITTSGVAGVPPFAIQMGNKATYLGEQEATISGCTFHVLHYQIRSEARDDALTTGGEGAGPKHSQVTMADKLYAPALGIVLSTKSQVLDDDRTVSATEFNPVAIETTFDRIKDPGE